MILHIIYDVITKKEIQFLKGQLKTQAQSLGLNGTDVSHLCHGDCLLLEDRYILLQNKNLIFTLVDFQTDQEYDCITNKTIFRHLNQPYNDNEGKYVYELKKQRQNLSTICGHLFYLKGKKPTNVYTRTNSESLNTIQNIRKYNKLKGRIVHQLRARIWWEIKKRLAVRKEGHTIELLGCSLEKFLGHIESQFQKGMTWDNYGQWHVDHIRPCYSFNIMDKREQRVCFHYTNLRPLWAKENLKKGRKYNLAPIHSNSVTRSIPQADTTPSPTI
jgi:hypothetical protein